MMKSYQLKRESWHYRLANFPSTRIWHTDSNICEYTRSVLAGLFFFALMAAVIGFFGAFIAYGLFGIIASLVTWSNMFNPASVIITAAPALVAIMLGVVLLKMKFDERGCTKEASFPMLAYQKFKDKTCFRIFFN